MTGLVWKGLFLMYEGGGENERKQEEANPGSNKKKNPFNSLGAFRTAAVLFV